ncbi:MAG: DUF4832 domain-containing protein [Acutalibacteraceae bacterium]
MMKKTKRILAVVLAVLLLITAALPSIAAQKPADEMTHKNNNAYLPFGWVYRDRGEDFASEKLDLVASYGIDTVYFSLGSVTLADDGTVTNHIAENKANGLWNNIGQWLSVAEKKGITLLPIINCNLNSTFLETNPDTQQPYSEDVKAELLSAVSQAVNDGFSYNGKTYYPSGVHFDCEPFRRQYHDFYLDMLEQMRCVLGESRTLSSATPAANGAWSDSYLAEVGACLDTINPMIYDSNGPSDWGSLNDGVTQNAEEYTQLVVNTCLWYSKVFSENNITCEISPTVPCYPDASTETDVGWPDAESTTVWYHLSSIENTANCIKGVQRANKQGAQISSLGIWNFYYMCGDADDYQTEVNGFYSPEADSAAWMSWVNGKTLSEIDYTDSLADLENPERGFYRPERIVLTESGCGKVTLPTTPLVHLRFGISALSPKNNDGNEPEFSSRMLEDIANVFSALRQNGQTAVIRFAYDDFDGVADCEPSIETIEKHIAQLAPLFDEYSDVIASVEAGFIGPWGEMHTSAMANQEVFNRLIDALVDAVPENIGITVRRPKFFADWVGIDLSEIDTYKAEEGTAAYRVGVFNDGYLGSSSDLGTYKDRDKEVAWLSDQATHTLFGGEAALIDSDRSYNSIDFISAEMFKTHTSYLNIEWNDTLVGLWQNELYEGSDIDYYGQTAYKYISDHLGYRFVLRSAALPESAKNSLSVDFAVLNVGCGNIVKPKQAEILFVQNGKVFSQDTEIDVRNWLSRETATVSINAEIPQGIEVGSCDVYLRISSDKSALTAVRFANDGIWNEQLGANLIGTFTVEEPEQTTTEETTTEITTETTTEQVTETTTETTTEKVTESTTEITTEPTTETTTQPVTQPSTQTTTQPASENPQPGDEENCSCMCHSTGFMSFIWKIVRFFYKLFGVNKVCACGAMHY